MPPATNSKLLIVDGHAYAYRAFHAIRQLTSPSGAPTNAIYGFIKMLDKMRTQLTPSHAVVVWDGGLARERMAELAEYKAQRPPMPADLEAQMDGIVHYLEAAGITSLCRDGVEADDWIAAIARGATEQMPVVIASSDKDFMQLVSERIGLLNPNDKSEKIWDAGDVRAKTGIDPAQIVDWLSLIGDSVDNIPGVPGVGPKTATDLLQQFGTVDAMYSRLGDVKSERLRSRLAEAEQSVRRNQRLVRLQENQPPFGLEETVIRAPQTDRLRLRFAEWGFRTMLAQLGEPVLRSSGAPQVAIGPRDTATGEGESPLCQGALL
jgi:DNA polymerase-1